MKRSTLTCVMECARPTVNMRASLRSSLANKPACMHTALHHCDHLPMLLYRVQHLANVRRLPHLQLRAERHLQPYPQGAAADCCQLDRRGNCQCSMQQLCNDQPRRPERLACHITQPNHSVLSRVAGRQRS